jgi:hypothetical protein
MSIDNPVTRQAVFSSFNEGIYKGDCTLRGKVYF